jgi:hypothetical protein
MPHSQVRQAPQHPCANNTNTVVNIPSATPHINPLQGAREQGQSSKSAAAPQDSELKRTPESSYQYANPSRAQSRPASVAAAPRSPYVPMLLGALALLGWLGFQTQQLINEREALKVAYVSQQQTVDSAGKLRASLDALASDTQRMADGGNPSAKLLVDELRRRGITINTAATSAALAAPVAPH